MNHSGIPVDRWNPRVQAQIAAQLEQDAARRGAKLQPIPESPPTKQRALAGQETGKVTILEATGILLARLPIKVVSEANERCHWAVKARRVKGQRLAVTDALRRRLAGRGKPQTIFLVRHGPRNLDTDNLQSAFKAIRDELADILGFDDKDQSVEWSVSQIQETKGNSVTIVIHWP